MILRAARWILRLPRRSVVLLLRAYRAVVSPIYGETCRFYPSCSAYALVAVERHGVVRGGRLAVWRLLRCNPWNPGGVDPVPPLVVLSHECSAESSESSTTSVDPNCAPSAFRRVA